MLSLAIAGCSGGGAVREEPNVEAEAETAPLTPEDELEKVAASLNPEMRARPEAKGVSSRPITSGVRSAAVFPPANEPAEEVGPPAPAPAPLAAVTDEAAPKPLSALVKEEGAAPKPLASALPPAPLVREEAFARALKLTAHELLSGPNEVEHAELTSLTASLSEREREAVESLRRMFKAISEGGNGTPDPAMVAEAVTAQAESLAALRTFGASRPVLCTRVEGFGRYTPFTEGGGTPSFLQGRAQTVLVYVEVENFAQRPGVVQGAGAREGGAGTWSSQVSQELGIYHDADGLYVWGRPEQIVTDTSRRRTRDYYLLQRVELPATLTIGKYSLKVTVRDKLTGSVAEAIGDFRIVADAALAAKAK